MADCTGSWVNDLTVRVAAQHLGSHGREIGQRILGSARHAAQPARKMIDGNNSAGAAITTAQVQAREEHHHQRADNGHYRAQRQREARSDGARGSPRHRH